jgi:hypothetical protein
MKWNFLTPNKKLSFELSISMDKNLCCCLKKRRFHLRSACLSCTRESNPQFCILNIHFFLLIRSFGDDLANYKCLVARQRFHVEAEMKTVSWTHRRFAWTYHHQHTYILFLSTDILANLSSIDLIQFICGMENSRLRERIYNQYAVRLT